MFIKKQKRRGMNDNQLPQFDIKNATKEQKIQGLCQIIDNETDKPEEERDLALIGECSAYLRELSNAKEKGTQEQKQRILQQIKARHNQPTAKILHPRWNNPKRIVAIALAAAMMLSISIVAVIAKVKGYSSAWEYVIENIQNVNDMAPGETIESGEITLIKNDSVIVYQSIEELLQTEGYDILYPSELPEDIKALELYYHRVDDEHMVYAFKFTDINLSFAISSVPTVSSEDLKKYERMENNIWSAYLVEKENGDYQLIGFDGKYEYLICHNDYEILINIFSCMGGIEK